MRKGLIFFFTILLLTPRIFSQSSNSFNTAEIKLAIEKLGVLGSVLYIAAHPDDENTALLATLTKGRLYRTTYLSITRGEGGQNLLGSEQGAALGLIRTQELLAARRIDGAEQYFTRAIDFGFSKSSKETLRFWDKEKTLADVVWVIRKFKPDVIITRFTPTLGGHGNHTASAILAEEAFRAASDSTKFTEQLRYVSTWQTKRIVWDVFRQPPIDSTQKQYPIVNIDLGAYSSLLGKSFTEIAGESRSMHKSQGFGAAQNRGEYIDHFQFIAGDPATKDLFDGIDTDWSRVKGADSVKVLFGEISQKYNFENPAQSIPLLMKALSSLNKLSQSSWIELKKEELVNVIFACAGMRIDATTPDNEFLPGSDLNFSCTILNRSSYPFVLERIKLPFESKDTVLHAKLEFNIPVKSGRTLKIPDQTEISQPYWLAEKHGVGSYTISDQDLIGKAMNEPVPKMEVALSSPDGIIETRIPLRQKIVDPVKGEQLYPLQIVPPVTINLSEPVYVFPNTSKKQISMTVKSFTSNVHAIVKLKLPEHWRSDPEIQDVELKNKGDEQIISFTVSPLNNAASGIVSAEVEYCGKIYNKCVQFVRYDHIPPQIFFQPAEAALVKSNIQKRGNIVGYIMGAGDQVPSSIRQLGYAVTLLSDDALADGNLDQYDVIVAGVRAYNTRSSLHLYQDRLMEFVKRGGTYVVQYVTPQQGVTDSIGPYRMEISRARVSEEDAEMKILNQHNPIVTTPNKITTDDFKGWIQERGLYFAEHWDARYDSIFSCHDANEPDHSGGLLVTKYGKGYFVYCAYAFFRQLPSGVEGAYRLFANILSLHSK